MATVEGQKVKTMLTTKARSEILAAEIRRHVKTGYVVQQRSETSAQLFRAKRLNPFIVLASFLLIGIGVFIFLAYYLYHVRQPDSIIALSVDETGHVSVRTLTGTVNETGALVVREYALPRRQRPSAAATASVVEAVLQPYSVHQHVR